MDQMEANKRTFETKKKMIGYDRNWGLKINIPEENLFDWRAY